MVTFSKISKPLTTQKSVDSQSNFRSFTRLEIGLLVIGFGLLWFLLYRFAKGGPVSTDVLYYFQLGQLGIADPFVINRYFHIYLQKLFVDGASTSLSGIQSLWAFLMSLSTVGVYLIAKLATPRSTQLHGLLAVLIFFSLRALPILMGVPYVDLTAMTMMVILIVLYMFSLRLDHRSIILLVILGIVTFLGFKTKEYFLSALIILAGLLWKDGRFFPRDSLKRLIPLLIGLIAGAIFLQVCHWLVLGKPLFGLQVEDYQIFNQTYAIKFLNSTRLNTAHANPYSQFIFLYLGTPFLLYILSIAKIEKLDVNRKLIWAVPFVFIVMMVYLIKALATYNERFFLPLMPLMSAFAPQFIDFTDGQIAAPSLKKLALHLGAGVLGAALMYAVKSVIISSGRDSALYMDVLLIPAALTLVFIVQILLNKSLVKSLVLVALLFALLMSPIQDNMREILVEQLNNENFTVAATPLIELKTVLENEIDFELAIEQRSVSTEDVRFFKDTNEVSALFNLVNDAKTTKRNFRLLTEIAETQAILACEKTYQFILLSTESWDTIKKPDCVSNIYQVDHFSISGRVLLIRK